MLVYTKHNNILKKFQVHTNNCVYFLAATFTTYVLPCVRFKSFMTQQTFLIDIIIPKIKKKLAKSVKPFLSEAIANEHHLIFIHIEYRYIDRQLIVNVSYFIITK